MPTELASYFDLSETNQYALRPGQIGCQASHLRVMQTIVERNIEAALVLEDDTIIDIAITQTIEEVLERLPVGWDIVRMCRPPKRAFRTLGALSFGRSLIRYSRIPVGRAGYLVSNRGARKLLTPRVMNCPGDVEISQAWRLKLDVYGVNPPPFIQERIALPSSIGNDRAPSSRLKRAAPNLKRVFYNVSKLGGYHWAKCALENLATRKLRKPAY